MVNCEMNVMDGAPKPRSGPSGTDEDPHHDRL